MNINVVHLCGNLTRDPQVNVIGDSKSVAKFGIAVNRKWKDQSGETKEEVTFVDVETWGKTAELVGQYLTKGAECYVQGRLKLDQWEKDGVKHSRLKVVADLVQFGRKANGGDRSAAPAAERNDPANTVVGSAPAMAPRPADDEPPF